MKTIIICGGSIIDYDFYKEALQESNFIICADGGATHLRKMGFSPNIIVGDLDSIEEADLDYFLDKNVELIRLNTEKDMTDTESAVEIAISKGSNEITFIASQGTRLDHTLANIFILKYLLDKGIKGRILNEHNEILIFDNRIEVTEKEGYKLSLVPLSESVTGITTEGLKYPLFNATINIGSALGVSNEFVSEKAAVSIKTGQMLLFLSKD